jgi:cell division GTPase FtsZ
MVRTSAKRKPGAKAKATNKRPASKAGVTKKSASSKRPTAKKQVSSKPKATKKRSTSKPKATKKSVTSRPKATKKSVTSRPKATKKSVTSRPKATKKSVTSRPKATKKRVISRPKATKKRTTSSRPKATKKRTTSRPKATKKSVTSRPKATKKRTTSRPKATKKSVTSRPKATKKRITSRPKATKKRVTSRPKVTRKPTKKVAQKRRSPVTSKGDFDFHAWLLPTLALEQYEPNNIEQEVGVVDQIKGSTRYAWIGAGQCGGRLVKSFYDLGYKKVLAVNTTHQDLDLLDIPKNQKFLMDIGEKGAGKDMERGKEAVQQHQQDILHLTRQTFGTQVDHIMVCFGAGGGTGSGSIVGLIEIAKRYARYIGLNNPNKNVGVVMTLPTVGEASSPLVAENAYKVAWELSQMATSGKISPLIIVDNDKINKMYPGMTVKSFWPSINNTVASLFDIFNKLSALSSQYTAFDPVDYHSIMESGGCAIMGLTKVTKFGDKFSLSEAVKKNLEKTLLAGGFDLTSSKVSGCIAVGGRKLMASAKGLQDNIDYSFDVLSEITGKATIHRGIYEDGRESLRVYTIIGGLSSPTERLEELRSHMTVQVR